MNLFGGFNFNFTLASVIGLIVAGFGLLLVVAIIRNARLMIVPEGIPVDQYYRDWKRRSRLKVGKKKTFVFAFAVAMLLTGLAIAFLQGSVSVTGLSLGRYIKPLELPAGIRNLLAYSLWVLAGVEIFLLLKVRKHYQQAKFARMSDEERAIRAEQEQNAELYRVIMAEAQRLRQLIPEHMAIQNRMQHEQGKGRSDGKKKRIRLKFEWIGITLTEIWFRFDGRPGKMPYGTSFSDLRNPNNHVVENIQYGVGRPCRFFEDNEFNLFLRIGLKNSLLGIPRKVTWANVYPHLPDNRYAVPVGVGENSKLVYHDFRKWPHILIAGATQQGKSTLVLQWITTLLKRNTPKQLQFIFIDLKEGVELNRFRDVPHTLRFIEEPEEVPDVLDWVHNEYTRRAKMFKGVCQDIKGWNSQKRNKLPYIIVVIDEMGDLMLDTKELRDKTVTVSTKLARKARMAGIHLWYATQIIEAKVLPLQIRGNFTARVSFSVPGYDESRLIMGNGLANGLEPVGRCVYKWGSSTRQLQAPIATDAEIADVIAAVRAGKGDDLQQFDDMDMFRVVLYNLGGVARYRDIYENVQGEMSEKRVRRTLKTHEFNFDDPAGSVLEIDEGCYILSHPTSGHGAGKTPRKLVPVNGTLPANENELFSMAWGQAAAACGNETGSESLSVAELEKDCA